MVFNQFPSTCNTVPRATNFVLRAWLRRHGRNRIKISTDSGILEMPIASIEGDKGDSFGNLYDKFVGAVPVTIDSLSGSNRPWTYASLPSDFITDLEGAGESFFVTSGAQTTFNIPSSVDNLAKAVIFWGLVYTHMYGHRSIWMLDALGIRPFPLADIQQNRVDTNGQPHFIYSVYIPRLRTGLSGGNSPWTFTDFPANVTIPPGYFS